MYSQNRPDSEYYRDVYSDLPHISKFSNVRFIEFGECRGGDDVANDVAVISK